ncbi:MAG TPA: hypothetical protein PKE12_03230 [Kiritimatiellia bacterium]|nr:hypothetical protein [Kiritimatiellia bacterium]
MLHERICMLAAVAGLAVGFAADAGAASATGTNHVLVQHAFTVGRPARGVASTANVLRAVSIGGIAAPAVSYRDSTVHSGYLLPMEAWWSLPDLTLFSVGAGRIWLEWMPAAADATYIIESAASLHDFAPAATGVTAHAWDAPVPATPATFFRVKARRPL